MASEIAATPSTHQNDWDDEITALALQLEELDGQGERQKGKYREDRPPDTQQAMAVFHAEIQSHINFLEDQKLARSIAHAIDTDEQAIASILSGETQAQQDRRLALESSGEDPGPEAPPPYTQLDPNDVRQVEFLLQRNTVSEDDGPLGPDEQADDTGPSTSYTERQGAALGRFSQKSSRCAACPEYFRMWNVVHLECGHAYCTGCLKKLFIVASTDQTRFPPICCRQTIALSLVVKEMSAGELEDFNLAQIEHFTENKTYCSNNECRRFIPPTNIRAERAQCDRCSSATCAMCKDTFHGGDCPQGPAREAALALAQSEGWGRCNACGALVELNGGCFHMT